MKIPFLANFFFKNSKLKFAKFAQDETYPRKSPAQIIFHIWDKWSGYQQRHQELSKEIVPLAKSAKTDKNKVAISSLVPRKDKC